MRVPFSWLRDYLTWDRSVEELAELLSLSGTEVERIDWVGAPRDDENLSLFRVGRVKSKERHPNADKLWLCMVDVGVESGGVKQIVCGADNFEAGDTVAVSLAGATLENGLKLRKANLRGVESNGMMLSEKELGFAPESPGIMVLPAQWKVGDRLTDHLPVAEAVLEIEVTPNRSDCYCIYGIAREVSAAAGLPLAPPPVDDPPTSGEPAAHDIAVEIADPDLCARYGARVIRGVQIGESPAWLKARLTHAGMRPISNVVDVTNYVMLAVGEPLHAFDATKIAGNTLIARRARPGEKIVTLDEIERALRPDNLVIADVGRPLVIAGIFGSIDAEVDEKTTDLVLEAATFNGPNIMRTSKEVGWRSEASTRFEKGLDASYVPQGLAMASRLFHDLCGGSVAPGTVDVWGADPAAPSRIDYRPVKADKLLGVVVDWEEQAAILRRLECNVEGSEGEFFVTPPSFRPDLEREVDLIEEVGRLHGLQSVPETLPLRRYAVGTLTAAQRLRRLVRQTLIGAGLDEVVCWSFVGREALERLELGEGDGRSAPVALANPMSGEQAVMRSTLVPGLLGAVRDNLAKLNFPLALFEQGRVYLPGEGGRPAAAAGQAAKDAGFARYARPWPVSEPETVGIALCGPAHTEAWTGAARPTDFYTLRGQVERLLAALGVEAIFEASSEPFLHPGKSADVFVAGRRAGSLGLIRSDIAARFGIDDAEVYVAELALDTLVASDRVTPLFEDLTTYPPASQDLAVVIDAGVPADRVVGLVRKAGGKLVRQALVFDVYEGEQVPEGKRSLALRVVMGSPERTLTEKDIAAVRDKVLAALARELDATLR
jgi:phenylalanyl-tRNA synthetase beta chain